MKNINQQVGTKSEQVGKTEKPIPTSKKNYCGICVPHETYRKLLSVRLHYKRLGQNVTNISLIDKWATAESKKVSKLEQQIKKNLQ